MFINPAFVFIFFNFILIVTSEYCNEVKIKTTFYLNNNFFILTQNKIYKLSDFKFNSKTIEFEYKIETREIDVKQDFTGSIIAYDSFKYTIFLIENEKLYSATIDIDNLNIIIENSDKKNDKANYEIYFSYWDPNDFTEFKSVSNNTYSLNFQRLLSSINLNYNIKSVSFITTKNPSVFIIDVDNNLYIYELVEKSMVLRKRIKISLLIDCDCRICDQSCQFNGFSYLDKLNEYIYLINSRLYSSNYDLIEVHKNQNLKTLFKYELKSFGQKNYLGVYKFLTTLIYDNNVFNEFKYEDNEFKKHEVTKYEPQLSGNYLNNFEYFLAFITINDLLVVFKENNYRIFKDNDVLEEKIRNNDMEFDKNLFSLFKKFNLSNFDPSELVFANIVKEKLYFKFLSNSINQIFVVIEKYSIVDFNLQFDSKPEVYFLNSATCSLSNNPFQNFISSKIDIQNDTSFVKYSFFFLFILCIFVFILFFVTKLKRKNFKFLTKAYLPDKKTNKKKDLVNKSSLSTLTNNRSLEQNSAFQKLLDLTSSQGSKGTPKLNYFIKKNTQKVTAPKVVNKNTKNQKVDKKINTNVNKISPSNKTIEISAISPKEIQAKLNQTKIKTNLKKNIQKK